MDGLRVHFMNIPKILIFKNLIEVVPCIYYRLGLQGRRLFVELVECSFNDHIRTIKTLEQENLVCTTQ